MFISLEISVMVVKFIGLSSLNIVSANRAVFSIKCDVASRSRAFEKIFKPNQNVIAHLFRSHTAADLLCVHIPRNGSSSFGKRNIKQADTFWRIRCSPVPISPAFQRFISYTSTSPARRYHKAVRINTTNNMGRHCFYILHQCLYLFL